MSSTRQSVTKKACDGCKIRKIRCRGGQPCQGCVNARIKCTYIRVQKTRGPQRLHTTTRLLIQQTQQSDDYRPDAVPSLSMSELLGTYDPSVTVSGRNTPPGNARIPTDILISPLYIYDVRMYPVWPVVDVEELVSALNQDTEGTDLETYALATAVAAATIAQLRLGKGTIPGESITADHLAAECVRARNLFNYRSKVNLHNVRTSFFLHIYHENQQSGGSESLMYLREAISLAQMMGLHNESSYYNLSLTEGRLRRRVLWLLFVTERGVCILHHFPVILKTNVSAPEIDGNDSSHILPAFIKLIDLFRLFEKSGMFDIIQNETSAADNIIGHASPVNRGLLETLQGNLQDSSILFDHMSDVQKADICVTRHWMRMILWKLSFNTGLLSSPSDRTTSLSFPMVVAKELVNMVAQLPRSAIEAHGLGMELKIYEIANSVADAVMNLTVAPRSLGCTLDNRPSHILSRLHSILLTFRGGGKKELVETLYRKMVEVQMKLGPALSVPLRTPTPQSPSEVQVGNGQPVPQRNKEIQSDPDMTEATTTNAMPAPVEYVLAYPGTSNQFIMDDFTHIPSNGGIEQVFDSPSAGQSQDMVFWTQYNHTEPSNVPYLLDAFIPSLASSYNTFNELAADTTLFPTQAQIYSIDAANELAIPQIPQISSLGVGAVGELVGDYEAI